METESVRPAGRKKGDFSRKISWLDRLIGVGDLSPDVLTSMRRERAMRTLEVAPWIAMASAAVAAIMLLAVSNDRSAPASIGWFLAATGLAVWLSYASHCILKGQGPRRFMSRTLWLYAVLQGAIWGLAPLVLMPEANAMTAAAILGCGGVLLSTSLLLMGVPVVSFSIVSCGAIAFLVSLGILLPFDRAAPMGGMILIFVATLPIFIVHHARVTTRRQREGMLSRERHDTALYLLESHEAQGRDLLWECDAEGHIVRPSRKLCELTGCDPATSDGAPGLALLAAAGVTDQGLSTIAEALATRAVFHEIQVEVRRDTGITWWLLSGRPRLSTSGAFTGFVGIGREFTVERQAQIDLARQSETDAMTGLANRRFFSAFLAAAAEREGRADAPVRFATMIFDLERFRSINETFGHATGDALILATAERVAACLCERQPEDHCFARLGGDEFALVLDGAGKAGAAAVATSIADALSQPFEVEGRIVRTAARIGIALAPSSTEDRAQMSRADADEGALLQRAELAMSQVKASGRAGWRFFHPGMDLDQRARLELERDLTEQLQTKEGALAFELLYQPLVDPIEGRPRGMEALIRWNHPRLGTISPAVFIPMAERLGLIERIGRWSLMTACRQAAQWAGPDAPSVAVNISAPHFAGGHLLHHVREALEASKLPVHRLEIEVTESVLVDNVSEAERTLNELHALGVHVALDDFGTGYSSLAYLQRFAFDKVKVDRQFVVAGEQDDRSKRILAMIVELGRSLEMIVVAEGIETHAQARMTAGLGCDLLQGYLFSRPISADKAAALIEAGCGEGEKIAVVAA